MVTLKHLIIIPLLAACIIFTRPSVASCPPIVLKYSPAASELAGRIMKLKERYWLEYKNAEDLLETCQIIVDLAPYTRFDKNDIAALILKESRFNHRAVNKKDGGRGLGQLTRIKDWHSDTLFWMTDPFDKRQNIIGMLIVLEDNFRRHKTKFLAVKTYNGFHWRSQKYAEDFLRKKRELISA